MVWFLAQREIVFNLYQVLQYKKGTAFQNGQHNSCTMMVGVKDKTEDEGDGAAKLSEGGRVSVCPAHRQWVCL